VYCDPTYIGADLRSVLVDAETLAIAAHPAWKTEVGSAAVTVTSTGQDADADGLSIVRAVARALWDAGTDDGGLAVRAGDDTARRALERWSLLADPDPLACSLK
jgi:hypothetical protein